MKHATLFTLLLLPALACDAQEGPDYPGEPIAAVRGSLVADEGAPDEAQAAILWYTSDNVECAGPTRECAVGFGGDELEIDWECADACVSDSCEPDALAVWVECVEACGGEPQASAFTGFSGCATGGLGEAVSLSVDSFPAQFELSLFDAPPPAALLEGPSDEPRVAFGALVALSLDAPETFDFNSDNEEEFSSIIGAVESHVVIYAADPIPASSVWGEFLGGAYSAGYHLVRAEDGEDCDSSGGCFSAGPSYEPEALGFDAELELRFASVWELLLPF